METEVFLVQAPFADRLVVLKKIRQRLPTRPRHQGTDRYVANTVKQECVRVVHRKHVQMYGSP